MTEGRPDRNEQRAARALAASRGITYMQALNQLRQPVQGWIKCLHYHDDGWTIQPGEETWISDIGRIDSRGHRVYRRDGTPWGEPSWKVADQVGLYLGGTLRVPIVVEVIESPEFNPELVQAEAHGGENDAGERWPWVTWVRGLHRAHLDDAPTLDDLRLPHKIVERRARFKIDSRTLELLRSELGG